MDWWLPEFFVYSPGFRGHSRVSYGFRGHSRVSYGSFLKVLIRVLLAGKDLRYLGNGYDLARKKNSRRYFKGPQKNQRVYNILGWSYF